MGEEKKSSLTLKHGKSTVVCMNTAMDFSEDASLIFHSYCIILSNCFIIIYAASSFVQA